MHDASCIISREIVKPHLNSVDVGGVAKRVTGTRHD
jgi:hypothetical protein